MTTSQRDLTVVPFPTNYISARGGEVIPGSLVIKLFVAVREGVEASPPPLKNLTPELWRQVMANKGDVAPSPAEDKSRVFQFPVGYISARSGEVIRESPVIDFVISAHRDCVKLKERPLSPSRILARSSVRRFRAKWPRLASLLEAILYPMFAEGELNGCEADAFVGFIHSRLLICKFKDPSRQAVARALVGLARGVHRLAVLISLDERRHEHYKNYVTINAEVILAKKTGRSKEAMLDSPVWQGAYNEAFHTVFLALESQMGKQAEEPKVAARGLVVRFPRKAGMRP